ncbi:hypothetical protein EON65_40375 [archaeon]|nr:MAG: hypothetical protein EON65_40375 [archaeon]
MFLGCIPVSYGRLYTRALDMRGKTKIDGSSNRKVMYAGTDISKVDGLGDKTLLADHKQNLTIHKRIDGQGCHKIIDFGTVEVLDRVDGEGDRWFINCSRVHIDKRKDGAGNLYLVDSPCFIHNKSGAGNVIWVGVEPVIKLHGVTDSGCMVHDENLRLKVEI